MRRLRAAGAGEKAGAQPGTGGSFKADTRRALARRKAGFFATLSDGRKPPCGGSGRLERGRKPERNRALF